MQSAHVHITHVSVCELWHWWRQRTRSACSSNMCASGITFTATGQGAGRDGEHWAAGAAAPQQVRGPGPHVPAVQARGRRPGHRSHHDGRLCQGERTAARPGSLLSLGLAQPAPARPAPAQPAPALPTA
eukprot:scaffold72307_cov20-Tisochrysis_lutea.AAC.2